MASETVKKMKHSSGKKVLKNLNKPASKKTQPVTTEGWWVYILLLSTVVILAQSLKGYKFSFENVTLTYSLFILPVIYFITNYIAKKYGYGKAIVGISVSGVVMVLFGLIMSFATGQGFSFYDICGEFCGYVVSQLINLTIYEFLLNNTTCPFILMFLTYIFSLVVFYLFYTLIYMNVLVFDNYWISYFSALIFQGIVCLMLTFFDSNIKRGIE